jgi:zinc and cadmium transporter
VKDVLVPTGGDAPTPSSVALPGLAMFLAIVLHKPADALAISTVLTRKGVRRGKLSLVQLGFASMIPLGAVAYVSISDSIARTMPKSVQDGVTGAVLAFSAGTFLFIALSDLLPEVQFHRHDRLGLFSALVAGVVFMGVIAYLEDLGGAHDHEAKPAATSGEDAEKGNDKEHLNHNADTDKRDRDERQVHHTH